MRRIGKLIFWVGIGTVLAGFVYGIVVVASRQHATQGGSEAVAIGTLVLFGGLFALIGGVVYIIARVRGAPQPVVGAPSVLEPTPTPDAPSVQEAAPVQSHWARVKHILYRASIVGLFLVWLVHLNADSLVTLHGFRSIFVNLSIVYLIGLPVLSLPLLLCAPEVRRRWVKIVKGVFGTCVALGSIGTLLPIALAYFCVPLFSPHDPTGCADSLLVFGMGIPLAQFVNGFGLVGYLAIHWRALLSQSAYPTRRKWWNGIMLVCVGVAVVLVLCSIGYSQDLAGHVSSQYTKEFTTASSAPSGMLVPTPQAIPVGFQESGHGFSEGSYSYLYTSTSSKYVSIRIQEKLDMVDDDYKSNTALQSQMTLGEPIPPRDFAFGGSPGIVYTLSPMDASDMISYDLHWNDSGKDLRIEATHVSKTSITPDTLIHMLNTFVRQP